MPGMYLSIGLHPGPKLIFSHLIGSLLTLKLLFHTHGKLFFKSAWFHVLF